MKNPRCCNYILVGKAQGNYEDTIARKSRCLTTLEAE